MLFQIKYTDKTIIEEVYGNNKAVYKVKFAYTVYMFGQPVKHGYKYDNIVFNTKESADDYVKFTVKPSRASISKSNDYQDVYRVFTIYDKDIKNINRFLSKLRKKVPAKIRDKFSTLKYDMPYFIRGTHYEYDARYQLENIAKSGCIYNENINMAYLKYVFSTLFVKVEMYTNEINRTLDNEFKAKTIVETNEFRMTGSECIHNPVKTDTCELDDARRDFIRDELGRIDTYKQTLIKLMK